MNIVSLVPPGSWHPKDLLKLFPNKDRGEQLLLHENRDTYLVHVNFPGFIKDDIRIYMREGVLHIHAASFLVTRNTLAPAFYGKRNIHKTVELPEEIVEEQIRYLYERNVLKIWIPKKHKSSRASLLSRFNPFRK